jgi:hypothetical protein
MNAFLAQIDIVRSHMVQCNGGYVGKLYHTKKKFCNGPTQ